ncbi:MAG: glycosyltransferase family 2 protein [Candidatus Binatia bacterium]|nr:glycosyltransferase family 2 protein [Candidatus Binatia bacterium]
MEIVVVIPAFEAAQLLPLSVAAWRRQCDRIIVVDPGSTDATASVAKSLGAEVMVLGHRGGPAEARNAGVKAASGSTVVVFSDADCVPADDAYTRVQEAFRASPSLVSLTGSYDAFPAARNFASLYMNIRHFATHQQARQTNATFWAGCGAVRTTAFEASGGFDAKRYPKPMIEDIELGYRLRRLGEMRLDPKLQTKHLKHWTIASVIKTDIQCRALPWSELLTTSGEIPNDLNVSLRERMAAAIAPLALIAGPIGILSILWSRPSLGLASLVVLMLSVACNWRLLSTFARNGGWWFAATAWAFHQVHLIYSALCFLYVCLRRKWRRH